MGLTKAVRKYAGSYSVNPSNTSITLPTSGRLCDNDIVVSAVSNLLNGYIRSRVNVGGVVGVLPYWESSGAVAVSAGTVASLPLKVYDSAIPTQATVIAEMAKLGYNLTTTNISDYVFQIGEDSYNLIAVNLSAGAVRMHRIRIGNVNYYLASIISENGANLSLYMSANTANMPNPKIIIRRKLMV